MSHFLDCPAYTRLLERAKTPIDLTQPGIICPQRLNVLRAEGCGYQLLYGTERVSEEIIQDLLALAHETGAIDKMEKMQKGEIVNLSEQRPALHTATRDLFDHPNPGPMAEKAAFLAKKEAEKLQTFIDLLNKDPRWTTLVVIGIGGSDLGPRAHYYALAQLQEKKKKIHFISNIDPDDAAATLDEINPAETLVVVISKSGSTIETAVNEAFLRERFIQLGLSAREHFIAVTTPNSAMDDSNKYREVFLIWDWVGGRYSTTSMVGGLLLAFAFGMPTYLEFLKGAHAMDRLALFPDIRHNIPLLLALLGIWNHHFLGYPTYAIIPYSQSLHRYPAHLQQLEMESNGKRVDIDGMPVSFQTAPILWGEPGTNAQHSFFQLLHQGTQIVPTLFIGFKESQKQKDIEIDGTTSQQKLLSNLFAQSLALATGVQDVPSYKQCLGNRPSSILLGKQLTPFTLGSLLSLFEHRTVFQGFIWGINSFDQEGVQLGKATANRFMKLFKAYNQRDNTQDLPETEDPVAQTFLDQLYAI